jgi:protoheme IX farnesyltransferase
MAALRDYVSLVKPGIITGNLISACGGFLLGSRGAVEWGTLLATLAGIALTIGGGCTLNNCVDRDIDARMQRTCNRPLPQGRIPLQHALLLGAALCLAGIAMLARFCDPLTAIVTAMGLGIYAGFYSLLFKRTPHGTWVGSLAGAVPPLAAYCAASHRLDWAGVILFAMYAAWQFPHAYAIAILHLQDYARAAIPVLPVTRGAARVKRFMPAYVLAFTGCALLLYLTRNAGLGYLAVLLALSAAWFRSSWKGRTTTDNRRWARRSFGYSILMVMGLSVMMSIDYVVPVTHVPTPSLALASQFVHLAFLNW